MTKTPLVTIICLCYNHENYVVSALESVLSQSHKNIELIIVDDASTDKSVKIIESWNVQHDFKFIKNRQNLGNTKSFNTALKYAKGDYIIDLAADDLLTKNSIALRLEQFKNSKIENLGIVYSNAECIDEKGNHIEYHFSEASNIFGNRIPKTGDVYKDLVSHYFVNPTTMLVKKDVFDKLNGYDESLSYEDFDFWIRSSRHFSYDYVDAVLVKKRILKNSLGSKFKKKKGKKLYKSALKVCNKAYHLNQNKLEDEALKARLIHDIKINVKLANIRISIGYLVLLVKVQFRIWF